MHTLQCSSRSILWTSLCMLVCTLNNFLSVSRHCYLYFCFFFPVDSHFTFRTLLKSLAVTIHSKLMLNVIKNSFFAFHTIARLQVTDDIARVLSLSLWHICSECHVTDIVNKGFVCLILFANLEQLHIGLTFLEHTTLLSFETRM